jgi:tripartite-type tricarboxylate transporter receptor subunit TctC
MITRRRLISLACTGSLAAIFPDTIRTAFAETVWRMLVGFGAGGAIDVIARMLVEGMKEHTPSFIVENRPGAGGRLALGALKSSPADGTAMVLAPASNFAVFPHVYKTLGYDAFRDFVPVTTVCSFPFLITVGPMVPADVTTLATLRSGARPIPSRRHTAPLRRDRCCILPA